MDKEKKIIKRLKELADLIKKGFVLKELSLFEIIVFIPNK